MSNSDRFISGPLALDSGQRFFSIGWYGSPPLLSSKPQTGFKQGVEAQNICTAPKLLTNAKDEALHSMSAKTKPREVQHGLLAEIGSGVWGSLTILLLPAVRRTLPRTVWQLLLVTHSTPQK